MTHSDASLHALDHYPTSACPKERRAEMRRLLLERNVVVGRAISCGVLLALSAGFAVFYGGFCAYAWTRDMHPSVGVLFSVLSGITLISAAVMAYRLREELKQAVVVPEKLRREAEAEEAIEHAVLDINLASIFWNDAARAAVANDVSATFVHGLRVQRASLERRQLEVVDSLRRYLAATAPGPSAVPPTDDWGPIETIDLTTRADS